VILYELRWKHEDAGRLDRLEVETCCSKQAGKFGNHEINFSLRTRTCS